MIAFALLALGCTTSPGNGLAGNLHDAAITPDGNPTPMVDANLPPGEPTYYGMVDDILAAHCWGCHSSDGGGIAPFVLDEYATAAMQAGHIAEQTAARTMPPFFAVNDGSCQTFQDHGRWLSDSDIAILGQWALNGAPEGDPSTPPPTRMAAPHIDAPDFQIQMPQAFTPQPRGTDPNEIRCFVADPNVTTDAFITAYEVLPGTASIVHHVIVYEPETDADAASAMGMQSTDGRPGYDCNGGPIVPAHPVALWAPGGHRVEYPADTGLAIPAGRQLIIQVHYNMNLMTSIPSDQSTIAFETMPSVSLPAQMLLVNQTNLSLAPRMASVTSAPRTMRAPATGRIWGVFPHMHTTGVHLGLTLQEGSAAPMCLVDVEQWDFNWQQDYFYTSPIDVSAGDRITIECQYDTSDRDQTTTFGEGTENEMCLSFFYVTGS